MADGNFYVDSRGPFIVADSAALTLSTSNQALLPLGNLPVLGSNYWWAGKLVRIRMFGRITSGSTPGTVTFSLWWGSGAGANGTSLVSSAAITLVASQTCMSFEMELYVRCRAIGGSGVGSLLATGKIMFNSAVVATNLQMIPASAPAAVAVDLTAANVLSPQVLSSTTTDSITIHEFSFEAMN
jgi:hypothetical protein